MPTNTRREKLAYLNNILDACHKNQINGRTPALADTIEGMIRRFGFGRATEKEYVRMIVDALLWEIRNDGKEFRFADA